MPDPTSLYPQPAQNALTGNPAQLIDTVGRLQNLNILMQQAPALAQQPAATLHGTLIANQQQQLALDTTKRQMIAGALSSQLFGKSNISPEDVHNATAYVARQFAPEDAPLINQTADLVLNEPRGLSAGVGMLQNMAMSPEAGSSRTPMMLPSGATASIPIAAANVGGAVPTGLPLGADTSTTTMQADLARARNFSSDLFPWTQALSTMERLQSQGETFGPGSKGRQEVESFAYTLAPQIARWAGVDPNKIGDYAEVEKYLTQGLQQRASSFGTHTDMQLATAASGSPNVHITDLAGIPLIKATIALRRMEQAQTLENAKLGGPNYTANTAAWSANQDPRAYMIDMMSPDQIKQLQSSLKGADRARFNNSLRAAIASGVVTPPGQ